MTKEPSFGTPRGVLSCLLILSLRATSIGPFPDYISFSHFFNKFLLFLGKITKFIKFWTKFYVRQAKKFCRLSALVCCCAANQYSVIARIFKKILKNSARSKG